MPSHQSCAIFSQSFWFTDSSIMVLLYCWTRFLHRNTFSWCSPIDSCSRNLVKPASTSSWLQAIKASLSSNASLQRWSEYRISEISLVLPSVFIYQSTIAAYALKRSSFFADNMKIFGPAETFLEVSFFEYSSRTICTFVPPAPNALIPALRGYSFFSWFSITTGAFQSSYSCCT